MGEWSLFIFVEYFGSPGVFVFLYLLDNLAQVLQTTVAAYLVDILEPGRPILLGYI